MTAFSWTLRPSIPPIRVSSIARTSTALAWIGFWPEFSSISRSIGLMHWDEEADTSTIEAPNARPRGEYSRSGSMTMTSSSVVSSSCASSFLVANPFPPPEVPTMKALPFIEDDRSMATRFLVVWFTP